MKCLDLYCCDGGAAIGLHNAGFDEIVGIDIDPHPNYPFEFIQADCLTLPINDFSEFDFIWASPPCQHYITQIKHYGVEHPDLVPQTRILLDKIGKPYCIENVMGAPIKEHLQLCGKMFGLKVYRHRKFEVSGFRVEQPRHPPHIWTSKKGEVFCVCGNTPLVSGHGGNKNQRRLHREIMNKTIFKGDITKLWQDAMGINWIKNRDVLSQAVPPAYSEYIGKEFIRYRENTNYANKEAPKAH